MQVGQAQNVLMTILPVGENSTIGPIMLASSNTAVFTVVQPDPSNPLEGSIVSVGPGTATLTATAQATDVDGTVHTITGTISVTVTPANVPATSISIALGPPFATGAAAPPPTTTAQAPTATPVPPKLSI